MAGFKEDLEHLTLQTRKHFSFSASFLYVERIDVFED